MYWKYNNGCNVDVEEEFLEDIWSHQYYFDDADVKEDTLKYLMKTYCDLSRIQYKLWKYNFKVL